MRQLRQLQVKAFGINGSRFPPLVCTNRSKHLQVPARARVKENALISPRCGYSHLRISPRCLMSITYFKVRTKKSLISQHISFPRPLKTWLAPREVQLTIPVDGMILSKGISRLKASTMNQTFGQWLSPLAASPRGQDTCRASTLGTVWKRSTEKGTTCGDIVTVPHQAFPFPIQLSKLKTLAEHLLHHRPQLSKKEKNANFTTLNLETLPGDFLWVFGSSLGTAQVRYKPGSMSSKTKKGKSPVIWLMRKHALIVICNYVIQ